MTEAFAVSATGGAALLTSLQDRRPPAGIVATLVADKYTKLKHRRAFPAETPWKAPPILVFATFANGSLLAA